MVIRRTVRIGVYVATVGLTAQLAATCAWGQQLYIYPQRGQSFDQEAVDFGGAALGAVGGAIGGDAGKGAAIGAGVGALFGGFRRMRAMEEEQAQMANYQAQTAQATGGFSRAYGACLQGRGYTVQ